MSDADPVLAADDGPVRVLTLNRPARLNAFTAGSYRLLGDLLTRAGDDPGVGAVLLRGAGRAFSSGVDLQALADNGADGDLGETFDQLLHALLVLDKPVVAAVRGPAVGFGATILLHCDLVLVADDARLRFPFTELGTAPEAGSSALLASAVGSQRAAELLFTSRWVDADEAVAWGLALRSCPVERLDEEAGELARQLAGPHAPAVAAAKRLLRWGRLDSVQAAVDRERQEAGGLGAVLGPLRGRVGRDRESGAAGPVSPGGGS